MRRALRRACAFLLALSVALTGASTARAQAGPTDVCVPSGIVLGFFNGVKTTEAQARSASMYLRYLYGSRLASTGEAITYPVFYNYTNGFEDFVETFEQRLREQDGILQGRYELFLQALQGQGSWWDSIVQFVSGTAALFDAIRQDIKATIARDLTALLANPPTSVNYAEHRSQISSFAVEGKKMVFLAHSQGNLFVNPAADFARSLTSADSVKVVHVAPASPTLRGPWVLADLDLVINGLRVTGSVPPVTDSIPGYLLRPPGLDNSTDILGHGLLAIYLNPALSVSGSVSGYVNAALSSVVAPPQQASSGFFTATLTWDGSGDVDLHTYEPGGSHVYYASKTGGAGYLDVDNVTALGPEHYYASCSTTKLQLGTYRIAVANYDRATGRTATVQISSSLNGVLGTKSVVLGSPTRDMPAFSLFNVLVSRDAQGRYSASLQ